jgi:hypothetical protein
VGRKRGGNKKKETGETEKPQKRVQEVKYLRAKPWLDEAEYNYLDYNYKLDLSHRFLLEHIDL